jgi:hypothetical protein
MAGWCERRGLAADMNIAGHGIALVDVAEMRRWIEDPRDRLIPRCFVRDPERDQ